MLGSPKYQVGDAVRFKPLDDYVDGVVCNVNSECLVRVVLIEIDKNLLFFLYHICHMTTYRLIFSYVVYGISSGNTCLC